MIWSNRSSARAKSNLTIADTASTSRRSRGGSRSGWASAASTWLSMAARSPKTEASARITRGSGKSGSAATASW
jgi:hypothetical protein